MAAAKGISPCVRNARIPLFQAISQVPHGALEPKSSTNSDMPPQSADKAPQMLDMRPHRRLEVLTFARIQLQRTWCAAVSSHLKT